MIEPIAPIRGSDQPKPTPRDHGAAPQEPEEGGERFAELVTTDALDRPAREGEAQSTSVPQFALDTDGPVAATVEPTVSGEKQSMRADPEPGRQVAAFPATEKASQFLPNAGETLAPVRAASDPAPSATADGAPPRPTGDPVKVPSTPAMTEKSVMPGGTQAQSGPTSAEIPPERGRAAIDGFNVARAETVPAVPAQAPAATALARVAKAPAVAVFDKANVTTVEGLVLEAGDTDTLAVRSDPRTLDIGTAGARAMAISSPPPQQVTQAIHQMLANARAGDTATTLLQLEPPELGTVRIVFSGSEGSLTATVVAERPEIDAMLRRHGGELAASLQEAGYGDVSLSFSLNSHTPQDQPGGDEDSGQNSHVVAPGNADDAGRRSGLTLIAGQLDLRI